jgi:transposase-like protein
MPARVGKRWQVDETYVKVGGQWRYVYRAVDEFRQVIDVFVFPRRDVIAARRFFQPALAAASARPIEIVTDKAVIYPIVLDELLPGAWHRTDRYANNHIEANHIRGLHQSGRLNALLGSLGVQPGDLGESRPGDRQQPQSRQVPP